MPKILEFNFKEYYQAVRKSWDENPTFTKVRLKY